MDKYGYAIIPMNVYMELVNEKKQVQELRELLNIAYEENEKLKEEVCDLKIELDR